VKTFLGTSLNAVLTQVWIALIVYLPPLVPEIQNQAQGFHAADVVLITAESL